MLVHQALKEDPFSGHLFIFRGRRGKLCKIIWWDSQSACLFSIRQERGRFVWPRAEDSKIMLRACPLSKLLESIDWRIQKKTWRPLRRADCPMSVAALKPLIYLLFFDVAYRCWATHGL